MKRYLLVMLSSLMIIININALDKNEFSFMGTETKDVVILGDGIEKVLAVYGNPNEKKLIKKSGDEPAYYYLVYEGLIIGYYEGLEKVALIKITSSAYSTIRGVTIGNSYASVLEKYGEFDFSQPGLILYRSEVDSTTPWDESVAIYFSFDKYCNLIEIEIS